MSDDAKITVDGKEYLLSSLSEIAKSQLVNLQVVDQKINALNQDLQLFQLARQQFVAMLTKNLPEQQ